MESQAAPTFDRNVLNGKTKNDSPNKTKSHFDVAIDNLFRTNRYQLDAFAGNKIECLVYVRNLVKSHLAAVRLRKCLTRDHFQQQHQLETISKIFFDILDLSSRFAQVRITPSGECLN